MGTRIRVSPGSYYFVAKIKQDHLFVGGSPICLLGVGYILKCLETYFWINLLENFDGYVEESCYLGKIIKMYQRTKFL